MVNAAGSEVGLPVPGLSNRSLHPPASNSVRGRTNFSLMSFVVWGKQDYLIYWEQQRKREGLI